MKKLTLLAIFIFVATSAFALDMRTGPKGMVDWPNNDREVYSCDDGFQDSGLYQDNLTVYSNAFDVGGGGMLTSIEFWHYAWGELAGPYDYMVIVYDEASCTVLCEIGPLQAADAMNDHVLESVDLTPYGCMVSGYVTVGIQALSMSPYGYYHPTIDFEYLPLDGCMRLVDYASSTGCDVPSDQGDFLLRIGVTDATPTEDSTFSTIKVMY